MPMPYTSINAYNEIRDNGLLTAARFKVYEYLTLHGPQTGNELDRALGSSAHKRLSELAEVGLIKVNGSRPDHLTGIENEVWEVIPGILPGDPLPVLTKPPRPTKAEVMQAAQEVNGLVLWLQQNQVTAMMTTLGNMPHLSPLAHRVLAWMKMGAP